MTVTTAVSPTPVSPSHDMTRPSQQTKGPPAQNALPGLGASLTAPFQIELGFSRTHDLARVVEEVQEDDCGKWDRLVPRRELAWQGERLVLPAAYAAAD